MENNVIYYKSTFTENLIVKINEVSKTINKRSKERTFPIMVGEYGSWMLDNIALPQYFNPNLNVDYLKRIHSESHFKKTNKFIINIDKKEGLFKILVDLRKDFKYKLMKGSKEICQSNNLNVINTISK